MRELQPGTAVTPSIRLVRRLGAGGMGSVWIADHLALRTQVVVKFMAVELAASTEAVDRFSREAAAAAQVKSTHVVQMFDHGITPDGVPFIVMELLEGHDLGKHLAARGRLSLAETAEIIGQVCKALGRAHERGIVHRDIKPDNIFLCTEGGGETFVKLLDFGIAKGDRLGGSSGTKTGAMIGTPYYMSPEQMMGAKTIDSRTDLWSLGVVAYECVVGRRPFEEEVFGALAVHIHSGPIPVPSEVDRSIPPAFDPWFATACTRDVAARFANARDFGEALARVAAGASPSVTPPAYWPTESAPPRAFTPPAASASPFVAQTSGARPGTHGGVGLPTLAPRPSGASAVTWIVALAAGLLALGIAGAIVFKRLASPSPAPSAATSAYGPSPIPPAISSPAPSPVASALTVPPTAAASASAAALPTGDTSSRIVPAPPASPLHLPPAVKVPPPRSAPIPAPSKSHDEKDIY